MPDKIFYKSTVLAIAIVLTLGTPALADTRYAPTAFESIAGKGIALLQENTLLDSVVRSFSTQLAAATLALPHFSLTTDIFSTSRNPVFHAFTHANARPVFASSNQPLPEPSVPSSSVGATGQAATSTPETP